MADVDEMITAKKRAGTYSGSMTLLRKLIQGVLVLPVLGFILSAIGYLTAEVGQKQADITQADSTLATMRLLFVLLPLVLLMLGLFFARFMNLDRQRHQTLMDEIARRQAGGAAGAVTPETRKVCEELTGLDYAKLYGQS